MTRARGRHFTPEQREEFRKRIEAFRATPDRADAATGELHGTLDPSPIEMDGAFSYEALIFAAKTPDNLVARVQKATPDDYAGTTIVIRYPAPSTLAMTFRVAAVLTAAPSDNEYRGWVVVELKRERDGHIK